MNFEQSLRHELTEINSLKDKVFPIVAKEGTKSPFLVYKRKNTTFRKTLNGTSTKAIGEYHLMVVASDYAELQSMTEDVKTKILSFWDRNVGMDGPYIDDINIELGEEEFVYEANLIGTTIKINVEY